MSYVCLAIPRSADAARLVGAPSSVLALGDHSTDLAGALLAIVPHIAVDARGLVWLDARGSDAASVAAQAYAAAAALAKRAGYPEPGVGVANTPIVAEVAATFGRSPVVVVPSGIDAAFLASFPIAALRPMPHLASACVAAGLAKCGDLIRLSREGVELLLGSAGLALWRLARTEDPRRIFSTFPSTLPSASLTWSTYVLRKSGQLANVADHLVAAVCTELHAWDDVARTMVLEITLADRTEREYILRPARPTASRATWRRLIERELEQLPPSDGVIGVALSVDDVGTDAAQQVDAFDRDAPLVRAVREAPVAVGAGYRVEFARPAMPRLLLQARPASRRITVKTARRHGNERVPSRLRTPEGQDLELLTVIGPDRVSVESHLGLARTREYFTCLTDNGLLMLVFHDSLTDGWYLHGWRD